MWAKYGWTYFQTVPGIYGIEGGKNWTGCVMNSNDATCTAKWKALDGGKWWARDATYSEPNGDYVAGCWLGMWATPNGNGDLQFNDGSCGYATGANYICSDNEK